MGIYLRGIFLLAVLVVLSSVNIAVFGYQCAFITKDQWGNDHICSNVAQEPYYNEEKGCNDYYCRPHTIGIKAAAESKKEGKKLVRTSSIVGSNPITLRRGSIDLGDNRGITKLNHIVMDGQSLHASIESVFQPVISYDVYVAPKDANDVQQPLDQAPPIIDAQSANPDRQEVVNNEQPPKAVTSPISLIQPVAQTFYIARQETGAASHPVYVATSHPDDNHLRKNAIVYSSKSPNAKTVKGVRQIVKELKKNPDTVISITNDLETEKFVLIDDFSSIIDKNNGITALSSGDDVGGGDPAYSSFVNEQQALLFLEDMLELDETGRHQNINKIIDKLKTDRQHIESMHGEINKRLLSLMTPVGVPSGDHEGLSLSLSNIWISGILGNSNQGFYKGKSGYKGKTKGTTIGSDFKINDTTLVGIAYGNIDAGFKYLHNHVGDKLKSINHVFSLYGSKAFNKLILQVTLSTSISHVKTADRRPTIFDANNTARGKFRSYGQATEGTLTYRLETENNFVIYPNVSFRGTRYGDKSYTETGAGIYNRNIESKSTHELTGLIGSRFMTNYKISEHNKIVAVLNASMEYNLNNKPQKVRTKFVWAEDYQTVYALRGKYPALGYNIGGGLSYKYKNMEVLVDYNYHLRQKYHNNYYALKFKLWF